ncbi:MAG TPA: HAD family hydrolase [Candidatus Sulfotelmatobacter sp.]|jgi:putative hydrolase of the HAD superfamily|nr:HAD family hydrolase [Candidatus Sulfotelmatobacter sp.]
MVEHRVIFFDIGNTLLFPNRAKMLAPLASDRHPSLEQWQALERRTKAEFDQGMQSGRADHGFWAIFHTYLLEALNEPMSGRNALVQQLVENTQNSDNWDQILPGTRAALERIREKFRIAVVSNADGKIERVLSRCGIADCFESITDSGIVGVEKPRPEIFEAALKTMNARPEESLYVGDVYSVDYVGATNAGMEAILFDVAGAYRDRSESRVESLAQLESWLQK